MTILRADLIRQDGNFMAWKGGNYVLVYELLGDDPEQSVPSIVDDAATNFGSPAPGAVYADDVGSRARKFDVKQKAVEGGTRTFEMTVRFMPQEDGQADQPLDRNPVLWEAVVWEEMERTIVPISSSKNLEELTGLGRGVGTNGAITNAAGMPVERQPEVELYNRIIVARKNYNNIDEVHAVQDAFENTWYSGGSLGDETFYGRPKHRARFQSIIPDKPKMYFGKVYIPATIKVNLDRSDMGTIYVDNVGTHELKGGNLVRILDDNKIPVTSPVALALDGTAKPAGSTVDQIRYLDLTEADYAGLGIGGIA